MIELDGATLIFPTSFGYFNPFMVDEAKKYPEDRVPPSDGRCGTRTRTRERRRLFRYIDQGHYVNGVAAGLRPRPTRSASSPPSRSRSSCATSIRSPLGAKKVNPAAEVHLIFTGDWSLPVREAESTQALIDAGCDVIACHVDSPKVVIETAEGRGVKTCGHNADQAPLAPKGFITGAEMNGARSTTPTPT